MLPSSRGSILMIGERSLVWFVSGLLSCPFGKDVKAPAFYAAARVCLLVSYPAAGILWFE
jgi:hypothetical protein